MQTRFGGIRYKCCAYTHFRTLRKQETVPAHSGTNSRKSNATQRKILTRDNEKSGGSIGLRHGVKAQSDTLLNANFCRTRAYMLVHFATGTYNRIQSTIVSILQAIDKPPQGPTNHTAHSEPRYSVRNLRATSRPRSAQTNEQGKRIVHALSSIPS